MNGKMERMWKATVVAYLKERLHHSPGRAEQAMKNVRVIGARPRFEPDTPLHGINKHHVQPGMQNCEEKGAHLKNMLQQT
jgi:hypothetical protein